MINWIKFQLVNTPNVHMETVKLFLEKYIDCMSKTEYENNKTDILTIKLSTSKQITIDELMRKLNIKKFENELNNLKKPN